MKPKLPPLRSGKFFSSSKRRRRDDPQPERAAGSQAFIISSVHGENPLVYI